MLLVLLPPLTLALGLTLMAVTEVSQTSLHIAENIDGVWLVIAVGIICLDSTGKLFVISLIGWRETLRKKS